MLLNTWKPPDGDWRKHLFNAGLQFVTSRLGGRPEAHRPLLGKWLKLAHDDAKTVYNLLAEAQLQDAADIKSWIMARLTAPKADTSVADAFKEIRG